MLVPSKLKKQKGTFQHVEKAGTISKINASQYNHLVSVLFKRKDSPGDSCSTSKNNTASLNHLTSALNLQPISKCIPEDLADIQLQQPFVHGNLFMAEYQGRAKRARHIASSKKREDLQKRDELFVQNLLKEVDKKIASEYGTDASGIQLTLDEIFKSLECLESGFGTSISINKAGRRLKVGEKRRHSILDVNHHGVNNSKHGYTKEQSTHDHHSYLESGKDPDLNCLLTESEEKLLLSDLEEDARRISSSLSLYVKCAGKNLSNCINSYLPYS